MPKPKALSPKHLRATLDPNKVPFKDSTEISSKSTRAKAQQPSQPRALEALKLGMHIKDKGYNIFVAGSPNLGRTYMVRNYLDPWAAKAPTPPDLVYVYNFQDPDRPKLLRLPSGTGKKLKADLSQALGKIRKEVPLRFDNEGYLKKRSAIMDRFHTAKDRLVDQMELAASEKGFNLDMDDQGALTLYPLVEGKLLSEEEFEKLDPTIKKKLKTRSERLMVAMSDLLRKISTEERGLREKELTLDLEVVGEILTEFFVPLVEKYTKAVNDESLEQYFKDTHEDILDNIEQFIPKEPMPGPLQLPEGFGGAMSSEHFFTRYDINLFVDNSETKGAPIIVEDHPTSFNLLGCIERESEMGALITDFTLIKSGALHRAMGGVLILHIEDLTDNPHAWEGMMRALRSGQAKIEDPGDGDQTRTKTIEPTPVPTDLKVILIGTDDTYELLLTHEDRFPKLFKIKAHLQNTVPRTAASMKIYLHQLARIIDEAQLAPFTRDGLAGLVDFGSSLAEDQKKLSLKLPLLRELMVEASAMASMNGKEMVDARVLRQAITGRDYRSNLYEEEFMEEYDREMIKVPTSGSAVGRVNGLSVTWLGDYEFGLPHQIACTVGVGEDGIVDLEREAELGGPIHTKAMMILKSYLLSQFAQTKPIRLTGSLHFEQSYAHVEGDSASGAELAALLSALSGRPIDFSLAFTGAVNQSGTIMAVGGVTRKIEGFFEVCRRHGLTGTQGVLIPADNKDHVMLKDEVVEAVEQGKFRIYPIRTIEEAMELLTNMNAGKRRANGEFPHGSLYRLVDTRLAQLTSLSLKNYRSTN